MMHLPISQGLTTTVNDEDFAVLAEFTWSAHRKTNGIYVVRKTLARDGLPRRMLYMQNEIMKPPPGLIVDHKDRNPLNNCRDNLRICTITQNSWNKPGKRNKSSAFKGVGFDNTKRRWRACIGINGKAQHIGYFKSEVDAAIAYNIAARQLHGEFAFLNEVEMKS